jgi:hypothetical protein
MGKTEHTAYRTRTIQVGNATVSIHQPILSDRERAMRTEELVSALARYGKAIVKN